MIRLAFQYLPIFKEVHAQAHLHAFQHLFYNLRIAADGNSLILIVKIVIVIHIPHRKAADNETWQFACPLSPLLLRISLNHFFRFPGCTDSPHFAECVHVKRQIIQFILVSGNRTVRIPVEFRKLLYIIPYFFVRSMEDMRSILMNLDPFHFFRVNVASYMRPAINHQDILASLIRFIGKYCAKQSRPYYQIVVLHLCICTFPDYFW